MNIKLRQLIPCRFNPRKEVDSSRIKELAGSIECEQLIQPLILRKNKKGYEVIAGNYRWKALEQLHSRNYVLKNHEYRLLNCSNKKAALISISENIKRCNLSDFEIAESLRLLKEEFQMSQHELADFFGKSQPWVSSMLALLEDEEEMPEVVKNDLYQTSDNGKFKISKGHWEALRRIPDKRLKGHLSKNIKKKEISVSKTKEIVRKEISKTKKVENDGFKAELITLFDFSICDERFGTDYPGRLPGQVIENILYYFTKPGDLVVDPMAGGGTTIDVCRAMGRPCLSFDLNPIRKDIKKNDILRGIPAPKASLVFLDPPYASINKGKYSPDARDLVNMKIDRFLSVMEKIAKEARKVLKSGGKLVLVMGCLLLKEKCIDLPFECYLIFRKYFKPIHRLCLTNRNYSGINFSNTLDARRKNYMLNGFRDIFVFEK